MSRWLHPQHSRSFLSAERCSCLGSHFAVSGISEDAKRAGKPPQKISFRRAPPTSRFKLFLLSPLPLVFLKRQIKIRDSCLRCKQFEVMKRGALKLGAT